MRYFKTIMCMLLILLAGILSVPITLFVIAKQIAKENAKDIKIFMYSDNDKHKTNKL